MEELVRLHKEDFDECFDLMSAVFGRQNGRQTDMKAELPKMCVRDEEHMNKHFGVRVDGKLVAALGVYPLPGFIGDEPVLFSTTGNVVTMPEFEGRGYMGRMLDRAMEELERIDADASRLGGYRQRYNRYGFETAGTLYYFEVDPNNTKYCHREDDPLTFSAIGPDDEEALRFADGLYRQGGIYIDRTAAPRMRDAYASMIAWRSVPYLARRQNGEPVGYFCLDKAGTGMNEVFAVNEKQLENVIFSFQKQAGKTISFSLAPCRREAVAYFSSVVGLSRIYAPSQYKIIHFDTVAGALMRLKARTFTGLPDGELTVEIAGYGTLRLFALHGDVGAERVNTAGKYRMDALAATRFLFGPYPYTYTTGFDPFAAAWLPLPLSWSTLDRV